MPRVDSLGGSPAARSSGTGVRISQRRSSQRRSFNYDKNPRRSLSASIHAPNRGVFKRSSTVGGGSESGGEDQTGTVGGVTFNTLCCVMGAGVLSLPYATRNGSVGFSLILMLITTMFATFGVYILACACDITKKYSYTECLAYALFPDMPLAERRAKQLEAKKLRKEERRVQAETKREIAGIDPSNQSTLQESANQQTNTTTLAPSTPSGGAELSTVCSSAAVSDDDSDDDSDLDEGIYDPATEGRNRKLRRWITMIMEAIIFLNNYGTITVYSRVIADSIPPVLNDFFGADGVWTSTWLWIVGPGIVFFILSCARGMEELKWTSIVGFVTIFYVVCLVITRYFTNMNDPISDSIKMKDGVAADVNWFTISLTCFSTISTYGLAFGYHYNVPYFYRELADRRPAVMMETVSLAFPVISICYISTGLLGYLTFGSQVADSHAEGNIINNYDSHDVAANIGRLGLFFHFAPVYPIISICCRRALHRLTCLAFMKPVPPTSVAEGAAAADTMTPPMSPVSGNNNTDAEEKLPLVVPTVDSDSGAPPGDPSTTRQSSIIIEAFAIVSTSALIAAFVPGIGVVVELVGALFGIPLMFLFPGMIGFQIFTDELAPYLFAKADIEARSLETTKKYVKWLRWGSIVIGLLGAVFQFCGLLAFFLTQTGVIH